MKTKSMLALVLICLAVPAMGSAQGLPEFLGVMGEGIGEGVAQTAARISQSLETDLDLALTADSARIEEGQTLTLTVAAKNPRAAETAVTFALQLPERIACQQETAWEAMLPPASADESGEIVPSVTTFVKTLTLMPGGKSEAAEIVCEMGMGPRFYRAKQAVDICVADVAVAAQMIGGEDGRLQPGDAFTWALTVSNSGMAAKDVELALMIPEGVSLAGELLPGLTLEGTRLSGSVRAEAAQAEEGGVQASLAVLELPMQVDEDALLGDEDAMRLMAGVLYADGKRVPLPRMQVCGAKISAQLVSDADEMEPGEETILRVMVVNEGLAGADVKLVCALPAGLVCMEEAKKPEATPAEAGLLPAGSDPAGPDGVPVLAAVKTEEAQITKENNTLMFSWHMDAAKENEDGVKASTKVFEIPVRALEAQENLKEQLVGASLAYSVDGSDMRFGEAVAMRVYTPSFMGIAHEDWNAIFWACVLMMITVSCLYAAVNAGTAKDEYCCE